MGAGLKLGPAGGDEGFSIDCEGKFVSGFVYGLLSSLRVRSPHLAHARFKTATCGF